MAGSPNWYVHRNGKNLGPFTTDNVRHYLRTGELSASDLVWHEALTDWLPAADTIEFSEDTPPRAEHLQQNILTKDAVSGPSIALGAPGDRRKTDSSGPGLFNGEQKKASVEINSEEKGNYFVRHWRGHLSLAKSYWLTNLLTYLILVLLAVPIAFLDFQKTPRLAAGYFIAYWCAVVALFVWQFVGLMRSASNYNSMYPKRYWGKVAQIMGVLGAISTVSTVVTVGVPQVREYAEIIKSATGKKAYSFRIIRNNTEVEISGRLDFGVSDDLREMLDTYPSIRTIHIGSIGGRIAEASTIANEIETRGLNTYVAANCESACVEIFAAGKQRLISQYSRIGLHSPNFPGMTTEELQAEKQRMVIYFRDRNIDTSLVVRAFQTPFENMWYPTHEELLQSGLATAYAGDDDVGITVGLGTDTKRVISEIEKDPLFVAVKTRFPAEYDQIMGVVTDAISKGRTLAETRSYTLEVIGGLYVKSQPTAGDQELLDFYQLQYRQAKSLSAVSAEKCNAYLRGDATGYQYKDIPLEAKENDTAVGARLILSAGRYTGPRIDDNSISAPSAEIILEVSRRTGATTDEVVKGLGFELSPQKNCEYLLSFFDVLFQMPEAKRSPLIRYMAQQETP